jgi:NADPH:quinone reductase
MVMKAVYLTETGSVDVLRFGELPEPSISPHDVLIRVRACSLNRLDVFTREGSHGTRITPPHVLGGDFAGEVVRVGEGVDSCQPGDQVIASGRGGYAELAVAPGDRVYLLPKGCRFDEGATLSVAGLTAWQMVMNRARVRPGEAVLITAAGSGVSTFAIQLCRTLGARVITTASSAEKLEKARALGAEAGIDYTHEDILERVRAFTGGEGVDVVLEHVGTPVWNACFESLKPGGRFVTCGVASGPRLLTRIDDHGRGPRHSRRHASVPESGGAGQGAGDRVPNISARAGRRGAPDDGSLEFLRQTRVEPRLKPAIGQVW